MRSLLFLSLFFLSCQNPVEAPVPDQRWEAFDAPSAKPLTAGERKALEGIFLIGEAADDFGKEAALKWSYIANGADTAHYLSVFCAEDVRYFILQAKKNATEILLNGYWRNVENTKTGKAHFTFPLSYLQPPGDAAAAEQHASLQLAGVYGMGNDKPEKPLSFQYTRPLHTGTDYLLIGHRGGGRNNDLLPASENSVEMLLLASLLGANGVEIDVQATRDSVPVLYHDEQINNRLTTKPALHGAIADYTYAELQKEINLLRGGKIPTLQQALDAVLYKTPLRFVWLDCKYNHNLPQVVALQKMYTQKAEAAGRQLQIVIGIPDEDVLGRFASLRDFQSIPSLCELDTAKAATINAAIWAPSWTKGHQTETVQALQARGKRAVVWTVDIPDKIREFMYEARFNGLCTNRPTMAAYYWYAKP